MTTETTMVAGPEFDAIMATRVMGWTPADRHAYGWGAGPLVWLTGEDPDGENANPTFQGFSPSTNIAHAMMLGRALPARPDGYRFVLRVVEYPYGRTYASFVMTEPDGDEWCEANSSEANGGSPTPLAICRAALAACAP